MEMSKYGFSLQRHTRTLQDLTTISETSVILKFNELKSEIEDEIWKAAYYLAYSYGMYDARIINMKENTGYHGTLAATISGKSRYSIERFQITMYENAFLFDLKTSILGY